MPTGLSDYTFFPSGGGANTAPVFDVSAVDGTGEACSALPYQSLKDKFALIKNGTCGVTTKTENAWDAGAIGVIVYMANASAPTSITVSGYLESFLGPVVMISQANGQSLKSYLGDPSGRTGNH